MARSFTKNLANYMTLGVGTLGTLMNGASAVSVHLWVFLGTPDTGQFDNVILSGILNAGGSNGIYLNVDGTTGSKLLVGGRAITGDAFQSRTSTADIGTAGYVSIGGVLNFGAGTITPYVNGSASGGGSATFGASVYTKGTPAVSDMLGAVNDAPLATTEQINGWVAELAIWNTALSAGDFTTLAGGVLASTVVGGNLISYVRLLGDNSPENDLVDSVSGTINGSLPKVTHPTINTFQPGWPIRRVYYV